MQSDGVARGVGDTVAQAHAVQSGEMNGLGDLAAPYVERTTHRDADFARVRRDLAQRIDGLRDQEFAVADRREGTPARHDRAVFQAADDRRVGPADVDAGDGRVAVA
jgi:hypothetical protein